MAGISCAFTEGRYYLPLALRQDSSARLNVSMLFSFARKYSRMVTTLSFSRLRSGGLAVNSAPGTPRGSGRRLLWTGSNDIGGRHKAAGGCEAASALPGLGLLSRLELPPLRLCRAFQPMAARQHEERGVAAFDGRSCRDSP